MVLFRPALSKLLAALALCGGVSDSRAATFEDDRGHEHTWDSDKKARVCLRAGVGGLSLHQLGMQADQLVCYWGLWGIRGSDFDPEDPSKGSIYPEADPTADEADFFEGAINMSPGCWKNPRGCFRWDYELMSNVTGLVESDQVDFILFIDNGNDGHMKEMEAEKGIKAIFVDTFYDKNPACRAANYTILDESKCYGRSMIDIVQRIEELAIFLGVDVDVPKQEKAKQEACDAATAFSVAMKEAHQRDMRIKVSILGTREYPADSGLNVPYARDFDPISLWVPRTLEELGAPLLHGGTYNKTAGENRDVVVDDFFPDCAAGQIDDACKDNTYHPVDFWLIDSRSYLVLEDWLNLNLFPDPAISARQFSYYPRNDGALSYRMIANLLKMYGEKISAADKVSKADPGECKPVDPKSSEIISKSGGLGLNDFICYNEDLIQKEYLVCPPVPAGGGTAVAAGDAVSAKEDDTGGAGSAKNDNDGDGSVPADGSAVSTKDESGGSNVAVSLVVILPSALWVAETLLFV